jgi:hypothetical protein
MLSLYENYANAQDVTLQVHCLSLSWLSPHPVLIVTHLAFRGYYGLWFSNTRVSMVTIAIELWVTSQPVFPYLWLVCGWHQNLGSHGHYIAWFVSDVKSVPMIMISSWVAPELGILWSLYSLVCEWHHNLCFHDYDQFVGGIRTWDLMVTIELGLWVTSQPVLP